jgi:hypothetical protein
MHRRQPYGPHPTAALTPAYKSLDIQAHRVALTQCDVRVPLGSWVSECL